MVSGNYFQVLGVEPAIGRLFTAEDGPGPGRRAVCGPELRLLAVAVPGRSGRARTHVRLNGYPMTIVGVSRRGFRSTDVSVGPEHVLCRR